jgi:hypothetical protein
MRFLVLSILLCTFLFLSSAFSNSSSIYQHTDSLQITAADSTLSTKAKEKLKETGLYKEFRNMGKYRALLFLVCFTGAIVALRFSDRLLGITDMLLLRVQHRPNTFKGFQYTGNPFILKGPFYALYHLFLGKNAYQSYLVWPLKYGIALSFLAVLIIRIFPDEALILSSLKAQIAFGLIFLSYLAIFVLLAIESFRKTKWLFPLRLTIFLLSGLLIFTIMYWLFWLIVFITILYLVTHHGREYITRQRLAAAGGYPHDDVLYEPWPDSSTKVYHE